MTDATTECPRCHAVTLPGALGSCARCELLMGLEPPAPRTFGEYDLLGELGHGRMGIVFRARHRVIPRDVALKMCRASGDEEVERFLVEAQEASRLDHPNIVPVFEYGEIEDEPYYTMKVMEGGSLDDHLEQLGGDPRRAAGLVATIAHAVHHGHERGVLHRDLKPGNILLDASGRPHVADFGLARRLDADGRITESGVVVGTPVYMAPEQAAGKDATTAADVYGLGAILYELLTGQPPFSGESLAEIFQRISSSEPAPPRSLNPRVSRDLETICLRCLEKVPARRYRSAEELAEDLERFLRDENIVARPIGRPERAWRWSRRHPVVAGLVIAFAIAAATGVSVAQQQEEDHRRDVLAANAYAARMAAGSVLFQLQEYADQVRQAATDPRIIKLLERRDAPCVVLDSPPQLSLAADSWLVLSTQGSPRGRWPEHPEGFCDKDFGWRDYFSGALALGRVEKRAVHVSRAYVSEADHRLKFGISTPVFAPAGGLLGVISASFATDAALGSLELGVANDPSQTAALIGPRDRAREEPDERWRHEYVFLIHDQIKHGEVLVFDGAQLQGLDLRAEAEGQPRNEELRLSGRQRVLTADHYRDPVPGFGGRWLAGLAPVGDTGLVMIVQTRYDVVLRPLFDSGRRVALPLTLGVLVVAAIAWLRRRRTVSR